MPFERREAVLKNTPLEPRLRAALGRCRSADIDCLRKEYLKFQLELVEEVDRDLAEFLRRYFEPYFRLGRAPIDEAAIEELIVKSVDAKLDDPDVRDNIKNLLGIDDAKYDELKEYIK